MTLTASDIAAYLALIVAVTSAFQTGRFNKRQNAFAETAERLNRLLIEREAQEKEQQKKAEVSANFVKIGKSDYRLKVFNRGEGLARNVRLEELEGTSLLDTRTMQQKFPVPALERHQTFELRVFVGLSSPRRIHVRLNWEDETGADHAKEVWLDVF